MSKYTQMKEKLKVWAEKQFCRWFPKPVDTTPDHFNAWFQRKLGQKLRGGDVYYAVKVKGSNTLPVINKKFQVFSDLENAQRKRKALTRDNPGINLEIVVVRTFYSFPEVD